MSSVLETRKRNVFRVTAAYTITGWLLLQVADLVAPALAQRPVPVEPPPATFTSAEAHYDDLLEQADGGTQHSRETLPEWSGVWVGGSNRSSLKHPTDAPLSPAYRAQLRRTSAADGG